jgi:hypothetical protein
LRVFLKSAKGPARSTGREVTTLAPVSVVRVFLKLGTGNQLFRTSPVR